MSIWRADSAEQSVNLRVQHSVKQSVQPSVKPSVKTKREIECEPQFETKCETQTQCQQSVILYHNFEGPGPQALGMHIEPTSSGSEARHGHLLRQRRHNGPGCGPSWNHIKKVAPRGRPTAAIPCQRPNYGLFRQGFHLEPGLVSKGS